MVFINAGGDSTLTIRQYLQSDEIAHSMRSSLLAKKIARTMGYSSDQQRRIERFCAYHDIGKSGVPPEVLLKTSSLTADEWHQIHRHSIYSYEILLKHGFPAEDALIVRWHHESLDGSGYPDGISGNRIPIESQIISIADYYDAITSPRPYREGYLSGSQALDQIGQLRGIKFMDAVVDGLIAVVLALQSVQLNSTNKFLVNQIPAPCKNSISVCHSKGGD